MTLWWGNREQYTKKDYGAELHLLLGSIALVTLELALPITTLQIYDRVLPNEAYGTLNVLLLGAFVALVIEFLLRFSRAKVIAFRGFSESHRLSRMAMQTLLNADLSKTKLLGSGDLSSKLGAISSLREFSSGAAFVIFVEVALAPVLIFLIAMIGGVLALVPVAILSVFVLITYCSAARLSRALERRKTEDVERFDFAIEKFEAAHTIKALSIEQRLSRTYEELKYRATARSFEVAKGMTRVFDLSAVFSNFVTFGVVAFGAILTLDGQLTAGGLIACILLSGRIMQPIQKALSLSIRWKTYKLAKADFQEWLDITQLPVAQDMAADVENTGSIEIKNLTFGFGDADPLFSGTDLSIQAGETVLLTGDPGVGKTTLFDLIAGSFAPDAGSIEINGCSLEAYPAQELTVHIGFLRSKAMTYRGTILENMTRFGQTNLEDTMYISKLIGVDAEVAKLPGGYATQLSGLGSDPIPPGLKQRIGMARSLAPRPKIVLFDDADTSLDRQSYNEIFQLFARLKSKVTLLMVTGDSHLSGLATRHLHISANGIEDLQPTSQSEMTVQKYRELRV